MDNHFSITERISNTQNKEEKHVDSDDYLLQEHRQRNSQVNKSEKTKLYGFRKTLPAASKREQILGKDNFKIS